MNGKTDVSIVVQCKDDVQMLVMYYDAGVTLVKGRRDKDGMIVIESKENITFEEEPELIKLYYAHAWDLRQLSALAEEFCWDGSKT